MRVLVAGAGGAICNDCARRAAKGASGARGRVAMPPLVEGRAPAGAADALQRVLDHAFAPGVSDGERAAAVEGGSETLALTTGARPTRGFTLVRVRFTKPHVIAEIVPTDRLGHSATVTVYFLYDGDRCALTRESYLLCAFSQRPGPRD